MNERLPRIQIAVVPAEGNVSPRARCGVCDRTPEKHEAVIRIRDLDPGRPGVPECVLHARCMQALLDASASVDEDDTFRAEFYDHIAN